MIQKYQKDDYFISTDKSKIDLQVVHCFLAHSYWAENIPLEVVKKSVENSLCFGIYHQNGQIGFARVITDFAVFAYLADVFVLDEYQGKGLAKWLMACVQAHPDLQHLRKWELATRDAHDLYAKYGFTRLNTPDAAMEKVDPDVYKKSI